MRIIPIAVLFAAGSLWHLHARGREPLEDSVAQHRQTLSEVDAQLAALEPGFARNARDVDHTLRAEAPLHLYVMSPAQLQPRGGEVVQIATRDLDGQPVTAKVTVALRDADSHQVLSRHEAVAVAGVASVPLSEGLAAMLQSRASVELVVEAEAGMAKARVQEALKVAAPAYVSHLITNKTVYRPGELLFFRALVLERAGLTPPAGPIALRCSLLNADGQAVGVASVQAGPGGIAAGELAVTDQLADGNYVLRVAAEHSGTDVRPHVRKLQIARDVYYDVQADRDLYKAGETVNLYVPRTLSQAPAQAQAPNKGKPETAANAMNADVFVDGQKLQLLNAFPFGNVGGPTPGPQIQPPAAPAPAPGGLNSGQGFGGAGNSRSSGMGSEPLW